MIVKKIKVIVTWSDALDGESDALSKSVSKKRRPPREKARRKTHAWASLLTPVGARYPSYPV